MPRIFQYHARHDVNEHGEYVFARTGVEYGHDGIKNLLHYVPGLDHALLSGFAETGSFTFAQRDDTAQFRAPFEITCVTDGTAHVSVRFRLPHDFGEFHAASLEFQVSKSADVSQLTASLRKGSTNDATISGVDVEPVGTESWEVFGLTPSSTYKHGDWCSLLFFVELTAGQSVEFSDISLSYLSGRGNVSA